MTPPTVQPGEPTPAAFAGVLSRYVAATRPAFLSVTLAAVLLGLAAARADGVPLDLAAALLTLAFALCAHAGVNVVNDYYDALNGTDSLNTERLFPFTGGSRFIQNGVLPLAAVRNFGFALLAAVVPAGLWLALHSGGGLIAIGMAGLFVGWAYSAPPFAFMSRGLGEFAIAAGWLLVVVGADYVQRGGFSALAAAAGLPYALHVVNILFINQFPDRRADALAGKRTLVVRLGAARARHGYLAIAGMAHGWLLGAVLAGVLPHAALLGLLTLPASLAAGRQLLVHADRPAALAPGIKLTILAANLHGLLLAGALAFLAP